MTVPAAAGAKPFFAPYVDLAGYPPPELTASGAKHVTMGFVTAREGSACAPTWGGYADYPATGGDAYRLANVRKLRARGGDVVISFGGQAGTELASVCSADELRDAYAAVIDAYSAKRVDFDIEGATISDSAANGKRAGVIAALQAARPGLKVSFTLPVLPTGLTADGVALVKQAQKAGVKVALVNIMAMDYGEQAAPNPKGKMAKYAIAAAKGTKRQLGLPLSKVSVTPMIGINDVSAEIFTLADARKLRKWAVKHKLGGLSMWQLGRDAPCKQPSETTQLDCSGVDQKPWAFTRALR